jgi:hypothetical protein
LGILGEVVWPKKKCSPDILEDDGFEREMVLSLPSSTWKMSWWPAET